MILMIAAAAVIASYSCEVDAPQHVRIEIGKASIVPTQLPPETQQRKFSITITDGDPLQAKLEWPGDPMQLAGEFPALATGPGTYAFSTYSAGPCLFTDDACIAQVNLVDADANSANVIIAPSATYKNADTGTRYPFVLILQGRCSRSGASA